jgi:hypothetical protein
MAGGLLAHELGMSTAHLLTSFACTAQVLFEILLAKNRPAPLGSKRSHRVFFDPFASLQVIIY